MNAIQMLDRILDPVTEAFTPEAARRLVAIRPDSAFQQRLDELATKSNHGELTEEDQREYKEYLDVIEIVSLLQAKARRMLETSSAHE